MSRKNISLIVSLLLIVMFVGATMLITAPRRDIVHAQADTATPTATATATPTSACASDAALEYGVVAEVDATWQTVQLENTYTAPVVIASVHLSDTTKPVVTRIRNASGSSFELRLQNPSGDSISANPVHYLVVEAGRWELPCCAKMTALRVTNAGTNYEVDWGITEMELLPAVAEYTAPVVLGQVLSYNDSTWSVFWSRSASSELAPCTASNCYVGKHVGEDTMTTRAAETLGVVIVETAAGVMPAGPWQAFVGADTVAGNNTSYVLDAFAVAPGVALVSQAAMDGANGSWAVLAGAEPLAANRITLRVDEDQIGDTERGHTNEQVGVLVFAKPSVTPTATPPPTSEWGCTWVSATANLPWTSSQVYTWTIPEGTSGVIEDVRVAPVPGTNIAEGYFWIPDVDDMEAGAYTDDGVGWHDAVRAVAGVAEQTGGGPSYTVGELDFCMSNICAPTPDCANYSVDTSGVYFGSDVNINVYNNASSDAYVERVVVDWQYAAAQAARNCDNELYAWVLEHVVGALGYDIWTGADYTAPSDITVSPAITAPAGELKIFTMGFGGTDAAFGALDGADDFGATVYLQNGCVLHNYAAPSAYSTCTPTPAPTATPDCADYTVTLSETVGANDVLGVVVNSAAISQTIDRVYLDWWLWKVEDAVNHDSIAVDNMYSGGVFWQGPDAWPNTDSDSEGVFTPAIAAANTTAAFHVIFTGTEWITTGTTVDALDIWFWLDNGCLISTAPMTGTLPVCPEGIYGCDNCCSDIVDLERLKACLQMMNEEDKRKCLELYQY